MKVEPHRMTMAAILGMAMALGSETAKADPRDYQFEAAQPQIAVSPSAPLAIRLIHVPSGKALTDAILFQPKLEMPMGAATMPTKITPSTPDGKGLYPFVADVAMAGPWTLTVSAKVQGEAATLTGKVLFTAVASDPAGSRDHGHGH
ncbi:FixH family protein [Magnetospirillum molischianum]|uniref:YtkA-like domain-containing protein n=1 Tax=Magnetospirillum molischianum DSM 120 TaxID=1150626 RepID=H8FNZ9_MAGML|nr:FixH family protein [Magnetospirillum molischianum]CCG40087.1 conserved exported hypothetical protein [Magnetospirillum molischianum DSM 120]